MRIFAISDIHGNNDLFKRAIEQIGFNKTDRLIIVGDLIDRGSDSKGVLDNVVSLKENGFQIEVLIGNHEEMLLDSFTDSKMYTQWLHLSGGDKTLNSFSVNSIHEIPKRYIDLIKTFKQSYVLDGFIFVHAALNMTIANPFEDKKTMLWERNPQKYFKKEWLKDRIVIKGHTPKSQDEIFNSVLKQEQVICIDNGSFLNKEKYGSLCVFELKSKKIEFVC